MRTDDTYHVTAGNGPPLRLRGESRLKLLLPAAQERGDERDDAVHDLILEHLEAAT